eukprot:COSAG01_NODE_3963_length_5491_cov_83.216617_5_plen_105_part_00
MHRTCWVCDQGCMPKVQRWWAPNYLLTVRCVHGTAGRRAVRALKRIWTSRVLHVAAYFDTPSFRLTLADMWLRKRDGVWELKIPGAHVDGMQAPASRYYASAVG